MELVSVFCPFTTTAGGETVSQTDGATRFVVDCNVNAVKLVGHVKMTFVPECTTASCGALLTIKQRSLAAIKRSGFRSPLLDGSDSSITARMQRPATFTADLSIRLSRKPSMTFLCGGPNEEPTATGNSPAAVLVVRSIVNFPERFPCTANLTWGFQ